MTDQSTRCICGGTNIEHSHDDRWECDDCGRFHSPKQLDRLAGYFA